MRSAISSRARRILKIKCNRFLDGLPEASYIYVNALCHVIWLFFVNVEFDRRHEANYLPESLEQAWKSDTLWTPRQHRRATAASPLRPFALSPFCLSTRRLDLLRRRSPRIAGGRCSRRAQR